MGIRRCRVNKLVFNFVLGVLGLFFGGYGLYVVNEINNNIDVVSNATSNAAANASSNLLVDMGQGKAVISGEFNSGIQACWYYQATYKSLHPYTVLWEQPRDGGYPKIRVIAEHGFWNAHTCSKDKNKEKNKAIAKLIGDEYITHQIEAKFSENDKYEYIATSKAKYHSVLLLDEKGRITHRRVKPAKYECRVPERFSKVCEDEDKKAKKSQNRKTEEGNPNYKNILIITELIDEKEKRKRYEEAIAGLIDEKEKRKRYEEVYDKAIELYLRRRTGLHIDLVDHGCGAVPIEPEYANKEEVLEKPSIVILCHKNNDRSHARVMARESGLYQAINEYDLLFEQKDSKETTQ